MASNLGLFDEVVFSAIGKAEEAVEKKLNCDALYYFGEIRQGFVSFFRDKIEILASRADKRDALGICLTTPGGQAEAVENMVDIVRHHYEHIYFIVPRMALSAGTIFCMAGDKIYMDYSSALGPIDPQVPDREQKTLVPALGYLDKVNELIDKSRNGTISPVEFAILQSQDLAVIRFYEQARDLSVSLLKKWLTKHKFKDWVTHRTHGIGDPVTDEEKERRAEEIATLLSNNNHWHSHGRMIGMRTLRDVARLEIDDFGLDAELSKAVRQYNDTLTDYLMRHNQDFCIYNRHIA